jgi:hypothetical protein
MWSKPSFVGWNLLGVSLCKVPGVAVGEGETWDAAVALSKNETTSTVANELNFRTLFIIIDDSPHQFVFNGKGQVHDK